MPLVPVPVGVRVDSGDLPVVTVDDVNAALPTFMQPGDLQPVLDGIRACLFVALSTFQARAGYAAALSDVLRAEGAQLQEIGAEHGIFQQAGEAQEAFRARIILPPALVTPTAILAAVTAIINPFTTILPRYHEALSDRYIIRSKFTNSQPIPRAYFYKRASVPCSPDYPDRGYPSLSATLVVPQREVGASRMYTDSIGRYFTIRVPDLSSVNGQAANVYNEGEAIGAFYIGAGTSSTNTSYVRANAVADTALYTSIINTVERIKGHSIRWSLVVDPKLQS